MKQIYFKLRDIPDLSLNKYQSLSSSGVDGILEKHKSFLRQWHRAAMLGDISLHLLISYEPSRAKSQKMQIGLLLNCLRENDAYFKKAVKVLNASPLSEFYELVEFESNKKSGLSDKVSCTPEIIEFTSVSMLYKKERFLEVAEDENSSIPFYIIPKWEVEESGRLYNMFKLMQSLDESCLYRVDLYPKDLSEEMHEIFSGPLAWLRNHTGFSSNSIRLTNDWQTQARDPNAEETLRQYEDWLKSLDTSPAFYANISVFARDIQTSQLLLDAASAEAISSGNSSIKTITGEFNTLSFLNEPKSELCSPGAPEKLKMWPRTFILEDISPFFRFPALYDGEFIEIPKETAPSYVENGLYIGKDTNGYDVNISVDGFKKHMFVCGVPGAGKTNTMLHLASSLWQIYNIPFLVLEPAKQEYRELARFDIPELVVFSPSANTKFPLALNPFEFPLKLTLSEHIAKLGEVFMGAFPLDAPAPFLLDRSIESIYGAKGWNIWDINDGTKPYPTMSELYEQFQKELKNTTYDGEIRGNIQSALEMRIGSLLRREMKEIFDVKISTIKPEDWLKRPVVIELEALGEGPANFTTLLLCTLIRETLKADPQSDKEKEVRHVIFIEEAHNLIAPTTQVESGGNSNPKIAATSFIIKMLAEVRALREGIIIADQLPTAMAPEVIKNTNIKLVHRLTSADDRALIGGSMSANELQLESVSTYIPGQALFTYEGLLRPFEIKVHNLPGHGSSTPNDQELYEIMKNKRGYMEVMSNYMEHRFELINNKFMMIKDRAWGMVEEIFNVTRNFLNYSDEDMKNKRIKYHKALNELEISGKIIEDNLMKLKGYSEFYNVEAVKRVNDNLKSVIDCYKKRLVEFNKLYEIKLRHKND
jgi:hypothetical protein